MIYLLTAIGLSPGGCYSTVQYTFTHKQYIEQHNSKNNTIHNSIEASMLRTACASLRSLLKDKLKCMCLIKVTVKETLKCMLLTKVIVIQSITLHLSKFSCLSAVVAVDVCLVQSPALCNVSSPSVPFTRNLPILRLSFYAPCPTSTFIVKAKSVPLFKHHSLKAYGGTDTGVWLLEFKTR
jgi:hypothetical protein